MRQRADDPIAELKREALEYTARTEVGRTTDAVIDAYGDVHEMERSEVIRMILNKWAAEQVAMQRLLARKLGGEGTSRHEPASAGTSRKRGARAVCDGE